MSVIAQFADLLPREKPTRADVICGDEKWPRQPNSSSMGAIEMMLLTPPSSNVNKHPCGRVAPLSSSSTTPGRRAVRCAITSSSIASRCRRKDMVSSLCMSVPVPVNPLELKGCAGNHIVITERSYFHDEQSSGLFAGRSRPELRASAARTLY